MKWLAQSHDLNPIENLWRELKKRFYLKWQATYTTPSASQDPYDQYCAVIQECWQEIGDEYIEKLVESMPRGCAAVIKAKGGATKY